MAMHYYSTGMSFQRVEDVHLISAINALRRDENLLPTRKQLSTSLLDECHLDLKKQSQQEHERCYFLSDHRLLVQRKK